MAYDGLAELVRVLEEQGELVRVRARVDARLELAAIADRVMKAGGPALLFENVAAPGQPRSAFPVLVNMYGSRARMSRALGVADLDEHVAAIEALVKAVAPGGGRSVADVARAVLTLPELAHVLPRKVERGACQEIVHTGDAVDLDALPVMTSWPQDGGPFFTLPVVFTRDPDTGARNLGMYRMQRFDRRTTGMHWQIHKTGARHFRRAKELGERLDVAVVLGGDPAYAYSATAPLPEGIDELLLAGFLRKKGVRLVKCVTNELEVPADADLVLEGYVDPSEPLRDEGPFGDHTGFYTPIEPFPAFHVTAVTHRRGAIYPSTIVGRPPMEDAWLGKATERLFLPLLRMQFPEIVDMNLPVEGAFHNLVVVSIKKTYPHHARKVAHAIWGAGQMMFTKAIVVVDADVDVHDHEEVAWRVLANMDPKRDFSFADGPSDQLCHAGDVACFGGKVAIDATAKWREEGYQRDWPAVCASDAQTLRAVHDRWDEYGIPLAATAPREKAAALVVGRLRKLFDAAKDAAREATRDRPR